MPRALRAAVVLIALALPLTSSASHNEETRLIDTIGRGARPRVEHAINRIQYLGNPPAVISALLHMAKGEGEGSRESALYALSILHPAGAGPVFTAALDDKLGAIRLASCQGLARLPVVPGALKKIAARLADPVPAVRRDCAHTLGSWSAKSEGRALARALTREADPDAVLAEVEALGKTGGSGAVAALEVKLHHPRAEVRYASARSLAQLDAGSGRKAIEGWASDPQVLVRLDAVALAAAVTSPWSTTLLESRLADPSAEVCIKAAQVLVARSDPEGLRALVIRAEHAEPEARPAFESALHALHVTEAQRLDILAAASGAK